MISSRADFLFFSALESEADDVSFRFADAAAVLRALLLRVELQEVADIQIVKVCVSFFSRAATNHYVIVVFLGLFFLKFFSTAVSRWVCTWAWRGRRYWTRLPD